MRIKTLISSLFVVVLFFSVSYSASIKVLSEQVIDARNKLKDYALVTCLIRIDFNSKLAEDLKYSKRSLSFMGKGKYMIIQDEKTFEIKHDPYAKAVTALINEAKQSLNYMKNGEISISYGCLRAYQSKKFNEFIVSQDEFISVK